MKRVSMVLLILMLASFVITFTSCTTDTEDLTGPINTNLPVITEIDASKSTVLIGGSIDVSVSANNGSSYQWTASKGTFADPTAAQTSWTAPTLDEAEVIKLQCKVSNGEGSRKASVSVRVATSLLPDGAIAYWSFDTDFTEAVNSAGADGGDGVSITSDAKVGSGAALFEGDEASTASALFYDIDAPMGPDDQFTVTMWMKTVDEELGFMFGRTFDGEYVEGGKGVYLDGGSVVFDISWVGDFWAEDVGVNDGEWHHIAIVKSDAELLIYVDGEEAGGGDIEEWSDDDDTIVTIGAAAEEPGGDWPGIFQGTLDDVIFFNTALSADDIADIANQ